MGIKEVNAAVIESQKKTGHWDKMVYCSEDNHFIQLTSGTKNAVCTVSFDINNIACVELSIRVDHANTKRTSKTLHASRWHINTAINALYKAAFNPSAVTKADLPFLLTANEEIITDLTKNLEFACKDKSVDFGFLKKGMTSFEKGLWLTALYAKVSGEKKPVFDLIFGDGAYDSFADITLEDAKEQAA